MEQAVGGAANAIVVIGGAGGIGSMRIQLARAITDLTVIATAWQPETQEWVNKMGDDHIVDDRQPLAPQI